MPELPDITVYLEALERQVLGRRLVGLRLLSPFVLRSVAPPPSALAGREVVGLRRLGKRVVLALSGELFAVLHLMIAGRLQWRRPGAGLRGRQTLAAFDFEDGALWLTEAGTRKRASLHLVQGESELARHDPGGLEVLAADRGAFAARLRIERHTLKRALTDPRLLSGIGNAYSDEILHRARLSPLQRTDRLRPDEIVRLHRAAREVLARWIERLRAEVGDGFPVHVTAFRPGMAVHGRHGQPCPACGDPVQRIVYAGSQANYCATCQTGGKLLADRALSRLLGADWPRTLDELEARLRPSGAGNAPD